MMARIELFIPHVLRWAAGVTQKSGESVEALFVRARKSGWSDHPLDKGGATQCDVTLSAYTDYCRRKGLPAPDKAALKAIPYAHWLDILKTMYWDRWKADKIRSQSVAELLVDWVWGSGATGIKRPQKLLGVTADGVVGVKTLDAVNSRDPRQLFEAVKADRIRFYYEIVARNPSQRIWLQGWLNRVNSQNSKS